MISDGGSSGGRLRDAMLIIMGSMMRCCWCTHFIGMQLRGVGGRLLGFNILRGWNANFFHFGGGAIWT